MIIHLSGEELGFMQQTFNGVAQRRLVMERHEAIDFSNGEEVMARGGVGLTTMSSLTFQSSGPSSIVMPCGR